MFTRSRLGLPANDDAWPTSVRTRPRADLRDRTAPVGPALHLPLPSESVGCARNDKTQDLCPRTIRESACSGEK